MVIEEEKRMQGHCSESSLYDINIWIACLEKKKRKEKKKKKFFFFEKFKLRLSGKIDKSNKD